MTRASTLVAFCLAASATTAPAQKWLTAPREVVPQVGDTIRAFADFDRDGRLDLVVTRARTNLSGIAQLRVDLATASGEYVTGPVLPLIAQGYQGDEYVLAGDVTGDGLPDIVTSLRELTNNPGSGIILYRNLGGGTFAAPVHTPAGVPWANGVLCDWNRDGVLELVTVQLGSGFGTVQRWTWQGTAFVAGNAVAAPDYVGNLAVGELTGDGLVDVVIGAADKNLIWVLPTLANGSLGAPVPYAIGPTPSIWGRQVACGDVDGDGDDDIVAAWPVDTFHSALAVVTQGRGGQLTIGPVQPLDVNPGGYWNGRPHVVDWDGDGDGDVVICWEYLYVLENQGAASFVPASVMRVAQSSSSASYLDGNLGAGAADFDGDGRIDFATGRVLVYGTGRHENAYFPAIFSSIQQPLDQDGDGDVDVLESGGLLRRNLGEQGFETRSLYPTPPPGFTYGEAYACGDFNGDGDLDLVTTLFQAQIMGATFIGMRLLAGVPGGRLSDVGPAGAAGVRVGDSWSFLLVQHDLDNDGDVDIAMQDGWWENNGSGVFLIFHPAWTGRALLVADADGNGSFDVLTVSYATSATTWRLERNQGGGATAPCTAVAGRDPRPAASASTAPATPAPRASSRCSGCAARRAPAPWSSCACARARAAASRCWCSGSAPPSCRTCRSLG